MNVNAIPASAGVEHAIRRAAQATGVDFDFLLKTARRESALNPGAKAPTSSAAGLFQFIEQTWLATLKKSGAKHGYGQYADLIHQGTDGRWRVAGSARNVVMDLRFDPQAASLMAAELTQANAAYLRGRTGRVPGGGDLYAAHFLGPAGAAQLMEAMVSRPGSSAAALFPAAASANRSIFYRDGRPATVAEVHANLQRTASGGAVTATPAAPALPPMSEKDMAIAERMDRLRHEQALIALLFDKGDPAESLLGGGGASSFLKAFAPPTESRQA
ncbi:transglycosylase SLT domain-containing protein [Brevundimonas lutea]|uniref:transglycosylase SLT domain-containing protein n=1 Tax=Brevundimonas lutea TaxID=2293980 RepID=UPI000F03ACB2|nr:transglycosylase SLT domain-containing protein [Brevundimonas lutea]